MRVNTCCTTALLAGHQPLDEYQRFVFYPQAPAKQSSERVITTVSQPPTHDNRKTFGYRISSCARAKHLIRSDLNDMKTHMLNIFVVGVSEFGHLHLRRTRFMGNGKQAHNTADRHAFSTASYP